MSIRFGVFKDFLEADTLLLLSDSSGFDELANRLDRSELSQSKTVALSEWGWVSPGHTTVELVGASFGSRVEISADGHRIVWRLAPSEKAAVVSKLRAVAGNARPGHQFLETEGDYQIIASQGEYPDSILG